jgi:Transferase family
MSHSGFERQPGYNPLTAFDLFYAKDRPQMLFVYDYRLDVELLSEALRTICRIEPDISSRVVRVNDRYYLRECPADLEVSTAHFDYPMPEFGPSLPLEDPTDMFGVSVADQITNLDEPICRMQINTFRSGHCILAVKLCHALCDATGRGMFLSALARAYRSRSVLTGFDTRREKLLPRHPANLLALESMSRLFSPDTEPRPKSWIGTSDYRILQISSASVVRLRADLSDGDTQSSRRPISAQDLLAAKIWTDIAQSNGYARSTLLKIENFRRNTDTGIDGTYFGNALAVAAVDYDFSRSTDLRNIARRIRAESEKVVLTQNVARLAAYDPVGDSLVYSGEADTKYLLLNNLSKFPVDTFDFGGGPPTWTGGLCRPARNVCLFPMTGPERPGFHAHINLATDDMTHFLQRIADDVFYQSRQQ